jgi:hypothetical protein
MHVETEDRDFNRDTKSMALLNVDKRGLELHKKRKQKFSEYEEINKTVEELKSDFDEMKKMLGLILEKVDNG